MSFPSAAALLVAASVKNRIRRIVRQPRHLIFVAVGAAYVLSVGVMRSFSDAATGLWHISSSANPARVPPWLAFVVLGYLALVWVFGTDATALAFTEAEVDFFFTAPVRRRTLVHYKLVRTLLASLATGAFFGFVLRRGVHPLFATVGFSLSIASLSLHRVCASMTRATFLEHGVSALKRRLVTLAIVGLVVGRTLFSISQVAASAPAFRQDDPRAWVTAANAWSETHEALLSWMLFPVVAMIRVVRAATATEFVAALPAALAVLAVHYVWAVSTDVAFEESAFETAQKIARRMNELQNGRFGPVPRTTPLFQLTANGPPWVAIFWKNLIAGTRISRRQLIAWFIVFLVCPSSLAWFVHEPRAYLGPLALSLAAFMTLIGPNLLQNDLRRDIDNMEALRALPVNSFEMALGELLAPMVTLASVEWTLLAVGAVLGVESGNRRLALLALACAFAMPAVTACVLVIRNLGALWFPSWAGSSALGVRGIEAFGQRLLILIGTLALLAFVLLPAGLVAAGVSFALGGWLGVAVAPLAGLAAGAVALAEAYAGLFVVARAFERLEVGGH